MLSSHRSFCLEIETFSTLQVKSLFFPGTARQGRCVQEFFTTKGTKYTKRNQGFPLCSFVTFVVESFLVSACPS